MSRYNDAIDYMKQHWELDENNFRRLLSGDVDTLFSAQGALNDLVLNFVDQQYVRILVPQAPTYVAVNQFSMPGDQSVFFEVGNRVEAFLDGGLVKWAAVQSYAADTGIVTLDDNILADPVHAIYVTVQKHGLAPFAYDVSARTFGEPGQTAWDAALAAIGPLEKTLVLGDGTWGRPTGDVPANVTLVAMPGCRIDPGASDLTIYGPFKAGRYQVFAPSGAGLVKFGSLSSRLATPEIEVAWWGPYDNSGEPEPVSTSDGTWVDSTAAFQAACHAAPAVTGGIWTGHEGVRVIVPLGCYLVGDLSPGLNRSGLGPQCTNSGLYGAGGKFSMTRIRRKNSAQSTLYLTADAAGAGDGFVIQGICWSSAADTSGGLVRCAVQIGDTSVSGYGWPTVKMVDNWFVGSGIFTYMDGAGNVVIEGGDLESGTELIKTGPAGVFDLDIHGVWAGSANIAHLSIDSAYQVLFHHNIIKLRTSSPYSAINFILIQPSTPTSVCREITIDNNLFIADGSHYVTDAGLRINAANGAVQRVAAHGNRFYGNIVRPWRITGTLTETASGLPLTGAVDCEFNNNRIYLTDNVIPSSLQYVISIEGGLRNDACGNKVTLLLGSASKPLTALVWNASLHGREDNNTLQLLSGATRTLQQMVYSTALGQTCRGNTLIANAIPVAVKVAGGTGLADLSFSGIFQGASTDQIQLKISTAGAMDKFEWALNGGAWSAETAITAGTEQYVVNGLYVKFAAATGHTLNSVWTLTGWNDLKPSGLFSGTPGDQIQVKITTVGSPDKFKWSLNGGDWSSELAFTGSPVLITEGISVSGATTGHVLGDVYWINPILLTVSAGVRAETNIDTRLRDNTCQVRADGSAVFTREWVATTANKVKADRSNLSTTQDRGDASVTLYPNLDGDIVIFNTALAADGRTVTVSTTSMPVSCRFRLIRTAAATGGNLVVGPGGSLLGNLPAGHWADLDYNSTTGAVLLSGYGALS